MLLLLLRGGEHSGGGRGLVHEVVVVLLLLLRRPDVAGSVEGAAADAHSALVTRRRFRVDVLGGGCRLHRSRRHRRRVSLVQHGGAAGGNGVQPICGRGH